MLYPADVAVYWPDPWSKLARPGRRRCRLRTVLRTFGLSFEDVERALGVGAGTPNVRRRHLGYLFAGQTIRHETPVDGDEAKAAPLAGRPDGLGDGRLDRLEPPERELGAGVRGVTDETPSETEELGFPGVRRLATDRHAPDGLQAPCLMRAFRLLTVARPDGPPRLPQKVTVWTRSVARRYTSDCRRAPATGPLPPRPAPSSPSRSAAGRDSGAPPR